MFRLACLIIGLVFGFLPAPPAKEAAPASSRLALYQRYRPLLAEVAVTAGACGLCRLLLRSGGDLTALWAGIGSLLAHLSPLHQSDEGGTAAACASEVFFSPVWGVLCAAAGMGVSALTGHKVLGAILPAALFVIPADLFCGAEAGALALAAALLLAFRHWKDLSLLIEGEDSGESSDEE